MPLTDAARRDVEGFLCHETALLDGRRFQEWLSLFTADALYWIPNGGGGDPTVDRSIVYDDYTRQPPLRTQRLVSNVVARQAEDGAVRVTSSQVVYIVHGGRQTLLPGACEHLPRCDSGQ